MTLRETIAAVQADGRNRDCRCPAHEDRRASLSVGRGEQGRILLHCQAGCDLDAVLSSEGLTRADLYERRNGSDDHRIVATYDYTDEQGVLLFQAVRLAPKDFRQRRPDGAGGWTWNVRGVRRVPFGLPALQRESVVYIPEGEKDVLALQQIGLVATCNAGGAGKWKDEHTSQLVAAGVRSVVILPDNDDPGRQHAEAVARVCQVAGLQVKVVSLPDLPPKGDVSDWLAAGHTRAELVALVKQTALYTVHANGSVPAPDRMARERGTDDITVRPVLVRLADVQPEAVQWLWTSRLAAGKLTLLVGDPGLGKSWATLDIAARATTGRPWPDGAPGIPPIDVLLLSAEDGLADTIRPRLDVLGADVARVHQLACLRAGEKERGVLLADVDMIERAIEQTGATLVVIDPMSAYIGTADSHRDAEVRGLLAPIAAMAERTGAAILGVMHLTKGGQRPAIYRAAGSIAFAAAARIVLAVAADPQQPERRILAPVKSNLSAPPATLAYSLPDGRLTWESAPVTDLDLESLLSGPPTSQDRAEQTDAEQVICELLEDESAWPIDAKQALDAGAAHGVHERTMRRTARRMGIRIERTGFGRGGRWAWHRPIADTKGTPFPTTENLSSMAPMTKQADIGDNNNIEDTKTSHRARARLEGSARPEDNDVRL